MSVENTSNNNELITSKYSFHFLADKPVYIEEMGKIFYNEWQQTYHAFEQYNLQDVISEMKEKHAHNNNQLPVLMIALDKTNENLVATIGLEIDDVSIGNPYHNTTPWLACVYTKPKYRGQGIAKYMINKMFEFAKQLNYTHVWLWTETARDLFEKSGFHFVEKIKHAGKEIIIMSIDFDTSNY